VSVLRDGIRCRIPRDSLSLKADKFWPRPSPKSSTAPRTLATVTKYKPDRYTV